MSRGRGDAGCFAQAAADSFRALLTSTLATARLCVGKCEKCLAGMGLCCLLSVLLIYLTS